MIVLNSSITINITLNSNTHPPSHSMMISVYDGDGGVHYDWEINNIEIDEQNKISDILNLKYFKLNNINNLNDTITWIDIDINNFKNIEIPQDITV